MATRAFFDITGKEGYLYIFDKSSNSLKDKIPFIIEDGVFRVEHLPQDIKESFVSLPIEMLNFRVLELPLSDLNRIRQVLPFELEGLILDDPNSVIIDAVILENLNGGRKVLAVYTDKKLLKELLDGLRAINIDPKAATSLDLGSALEESASAKDLSRLLLEYRTENEKRIQRAQKEIETCTVNLLRGELSNTKEMEKTRRSLRLTLALIIILTLVFTADMALKITTVKKEVSYIENEILKTYSGIFPEEKLQGSQGLIYRMKSHLKEMKDKDSIFSGVSPLELLLKLGELKLTTLTEITLEKDLIVLKGEASSLSEVQQIKTRLETMFSDVKVSDTSQSAQNKIVFTITAKEKEA